MKKTMANGSTVFSDDPMGLKGRNAAQLDQKQKDQDQDLLADEEGEYDYEEYGEEEEELEVDDVDGVQL